MLKTAHLTTACRRPAHPDLDNCMLVWIGYCSHHLRLNAQQKKHIDTEDEAIVNLHFTVNKCIKCGPIFQKSNKNQLQNYCAMHMTYLLMLHVKNVHWQANYSLCHMQLTF